jgi:hypothetical protein
MDMALFWLLVAACGCLWLRVAACGCLWLLVAACGCLWLLVAACGCLWLLVAACGCAHCHCPWVPTIQRAAEALRESEARARSERLAREHAEARALEERLRLSADSDADRARLQQEIKLAEEQRTAVHLGGCTRDGARAVLPACRAVLSAFPSRFPVYVIKHDVSECVCVFCDAVPVAGPGCSTG